MHFRLIFFNLFALFVVVFVVVLHLFAVVLHLSVYVLLLFLVFNRHLFVVILSVSLVVMQLWHIFGLFAAVYLCGYFAFHCSFFICRFWYSVQDLYPVDLFSINP